MIGEGPVCGIARTGAFGPRRCARQRTEASSTLFRMKTARILLATALGVGCSDVKDHLDAGRIGAACERAIRHPEETPLLHNWAMDHVKVTAELVPAWDVEAVLGGVVRGYGTELGLYALSVSVPDGSGALAPQKGDLGIEALVARLPPLVRLSRAPSVAAVVEDELLPTSAGSPWRVARDPVSQIIDAVGTMGMGVGMGVALAVGVPIGLMIGAINGAASVLGSLFGGGGGGDHQTLEQRVAPLTVQEPVDQLSVDALLQPAELADAQAKLDAEYLQHVDAIALERTRRVALASDPAFLGADRSACERGACRAVFLQRPTSANVTLWFPGPDAADACGVEGLVLPVLPSSPASSSTPASLAAVPSSPTAFVPLTTSLDALAPSYALDHAGALPKGALPKGALPKRATHSQEAVARIDDLVCDVHVKRARFDSDGTAPDLVARLNAGYARTRAHTVFLGKNIVDAAFLTPDLGLVPGERIRLSLVSRGDRSLGAAIAEFDGRVPLVLENAAFHATCGVATIAAPMIERARSDATKAVAAFADAAGDAGVANAKQLTALAKGRIAARASIVKLAATVGASDPLVQQLASALGAVDPLRSRSQP